MNTYSVSELIDVLKNTLIQQELLSNLYINGEIANYGISKNGHAYFTLKDKSAKISCVIFANRIRSLNFLPSDGMLVLLHGVVSIYEASGQIQLNVFSMENSGIGDLFKKYTELKYKLEQEGLFLNGNKLMIPKYPWKIAIVTGKDSAAEADIRINLKRRWPIATIDYFHANVQGNLASQEIIKNLITIEKLNYDLVILARGGGSFEDLNSFNDEALVRHIYQLKIPLITGIGHESDFTLCDFVADLRAATPTAAVELATPRIEDVIKEFKILEERLMMSLSRQYRDNLTQLKLLRHKLENQLALLSANLDNFRLISEKFKKQAIQYFQINNRLLTLLGNQLTNALNMYQIKLHANWENKIALLDAFGPLKILNRGYGIVYNCNKVVKSISDVMISDVVSIHLADGTIAAIVKEKK